MPIKIEGFTDRQRKIADVLWMMNGKDAVLSFIDSLEADTKRDAHVVLYMMVAAFSDEVEQIFPETQEVIDKFRL
jgi:hypothetical protein